MPNFTKIRVWHRSHTIHSDLLQYPRRGVSFCERVSINPFDVRVRESVINEPSGRFCCQTVTSISRDNRIADLYHARFVGFALVTTGTDKRIILDVDKEVSPLAKHTGAALRRL